jgi:transcriptional regulator with XRE-family HTH domain
MTKKEFQQKRKILGLTQRELTQYFGFLSVNSISEIERGNIRVPLNSAWIFKNLERDLLNKKIVC